MSQTNVSAMFDNDKIVWFRLANKQTFHMGSGLCSRDLDVLRAQRIIVFLITHKSTGSEIPIARKSSFA